jgi:hypothetical protein
MAERDASMSTMAKAKNKIASGLHSLMNAKGIKARVTFITEFITAHLNKRMAWHKNLLRLIANLQVR